MRIDSLTIQNFNGFERCELSFDPHFNLLVGDNTSGKTSVLDALSILLDSWVLGVKGDETGGGIHQNQVRLKAHKHEDSFSFEPQFPARLEASGEVLGCRVKWARELAKAGGRTTHVEARSMSKIAEASAQRVREGSPETLPLICSYGTERLWYETRHWKSRKSKEIKSPHPSRLDGYKDCNAFEIQETALLAWIRAQYLDGLALEKKKTIAFVSIERAVIGCLEGATSLRYSERYKDAIVEVESEGPQFFRNLSDGQRILLTLVGDLAKRAVALNPDLGEEVSKQTPGVVLIDELDLHLHPKWQRRIIHDLKRTFPLIQFITTTHSPQLIGEAQPSEIRILAGGKVYTPSRSFGLDSSRVLGEIQGAEKRNPDVESLIHDISLAIDQEKFDEARKLILDLEGKVGPDDAEVTRARSLMNFMEAPQ